MSHIRLENYTKILKGRTVLSDINLSVEPSEFLMLHGANGSGKTMLLRAIAGLILPTEGHVTVDSKRLTLSDRFPESMGIMIENTKFWPRYSALETLDLIASIKKSANDDDLRSALSRVGLDPESKLAVGKFSLGMKQRLSIAQTLIEKPRLLLLDEPVNSIDKEGYKYFLNILEEEKAKGTTVVMASHINEDLDHLCDRILEMDEGKILED